ncbi:response regulator [Rhizobium deserti]|uniref:Response regulator n=1 Tax=Rhizobium deserti TaxID=2547961 RepID=A0A4R5UPH3_9HYPH|nr:response regulator [Rhizobium deserti]TDK39718.1 response regulator [Rhizobium deserti]
MEQKKSALRSPMMKKQSRMPYKVLVIEDHFLIAAAAEQAIADLGYEVIGAAASRSHALDYLGEADIALIDLNLLDGASGLDIARDFSKHGTAVVIVTANPEAVPPNTDVAIGVLAKPVDDASLSRVLKYLVSRIEGRESRCPRELHLLAGAPMSEA